MKIQLLVTVEVEEDGITEKDKERLHTAFPDMVRNELEYPVSKAKLFLRKAKMRGVMLREIELVPDPATPKNKISTD